MNKTDTDKRAAILAATLPAYLFRRSRPPESNLALALPEAACATHEELTSLIVDALHFARSKGWEPGELLGDAALAFSAKEDDAPTPADDHTGEAPCSACGEPTGEGITCPNGNFVCRACFDAGSDGPEEEPSLRVFYVCPCGKEWAEENGPEHGACDSECECGTTVEADRWEEI